MIQDFERNVLPKWVASEPRRDSTFDDRLLDPEHAKRVVAVINVELMKVALNYQDEQNGYKTTRQEMLIGAWAGITSMRQQKGTAPKIPDASQSILLRDAQYYMWGRSGPGRFERDLHIPDFISIGGSSYAYIGYTTLKVIGGNLVAATNAPVSPAGGRDWFELGVMHFTTWDKDMADKPSPPPFIATPPTYTDPLFLDETFGNDPRGPGRTQQ